ncbi:MAG: PLD nuclease N-terminal domain-containing protein [Candidatus Sulfobium sp.]
MGKMRIPVFLFFFLCLALPSYAGEKVYTNADLSTPAPSLDKNARIDPATGKVIRDANDSSYGSTHAESWHETAARTVRRVRDHVGMAINQIKTNMTALAAVIGFLFVLWVACLVDILRNEFLGNNKLIWFIAVTFIPVVGCLLYFFIGTRQKKYRIIRDS